MSGSLHPKLVPRDPKQLSSIIMSDSSLHFYTVWLGIVQKHLNDSIYFTFLHYRIGLISKLFTFFLFIEEEWEFGANSIGIWAVKFF